MLATLRLLCPALVVSVLSSAAARAQQTDPSPARWMSLFNGEDLTGWTPKITGYDVGENFGETFRVVDGLLTVAYDAYDDGFRGRFGHLFHDMEFADYRLRVEYRFFGEQVEGGPGWAFRNSGLMLHGQPAASMQKDQDFPASIEVQLLGGRDKGTRSTLNLCTPGTNVVRDGKLWTNHCWNSQSQTYRGDVWVTAEVEVRGDTIRHLMDGHTVMSYDDPQLDPRDGDAKRLLADGRGEQLRRGTISLQSESHPVQFRKVELLPLDAPGPWLEPLAAAKLSDNFATEGNWSLADGVATLTPSEGQRGWQRYGHYLWLEGDYAEFEAEFEYRLQERGNSGFYFHVGDRAQPVRTGVEVQLYATPPKKPAQRLTDHDAGGIIPGGPPRENASQQPGSWNRIHVRVEDGEVRVTLNGRLVHVMALDHRAIADRPATGAIGFQDHSLPLDLRRFRVRKL
ncbi:MAG: 3-keto-disaccharide hydrolase [Planctomycetota bacterium]